VRLLLDGVTGAGAPADTAVLVVRGADGGQAARTDLKWTDEEYYLAMLNGLPDGTYSLSAELTVGDTTVIADGPDIALRPRGPSPSGGDAG
jgi:hypothetical protein